MVTEKLEAPKFTRELKDVEVREGQKVKMDGLVKAIPRPDITW